jgi:hypothetical protein
MPHPPSGSSEKIVTTHVTSEKTGARHVNNEQIVTRHVNKEKTVGRHAANEKTDVTHINNDSSDIRVKSIKNKRGYSTKHHNTTGLSHNRSTAKQRPCLNPLLDSA